MCEGSTLVFSDPQGAILTTMLVSRNFSGECRSAKQTAEGTCQRPRERRGEQDDTPSVSCRLFAHADVRALEHTAG